jgi:aminoglycoside phosphotransferase (APT) family kinase protein
VQTDVRAPRAQEIVMSQASDLLAAARREGVTLTAPTDALDTMGLDFVVVHATDAAGTPWIVRSPRRPDAVEAARIEARVLALVAPRLPVAVPDWRVHADDVIAYPRLSGVPAVTLDTGTPTWNRIDPAAPSEGFLDSFADALAAMLAISVDDARAAGVTVRSIDEDRAELSRAIESSREALGPPAETLARWRRWLADDVSWPNQLGFIHGDLHPGHMLLDDDGRLTGILDWTEAKVTDPSVDLSVFHGCFGRAATEAMVTRLAARGVPLWPTVIDHCAERWAIAPALAADWALRKHNPHVLEYARAQLVG